MKMSNLSDIFDKTRKNQSIVVRITDFCNNKCAHCCFECSPNNKNFMNIEVIKKINDVFADTKEVCYWFNVMGGEPTLHKNYEDLIEIFKGRHVRLVTNGWWINNDKARDRFLTFLNSTGVIIHVGVSRDKFHPKGVGDRAFAFLQEHKIADDFGLSTPNSENEEDSIASVGRAFHNNIGYMRSVFGAYCQTSNTRNTSFTILEDGTITHCPFGIWPIGTLDDGIDRLYKEKEVRVKRWEDAMVTCRSCYQTWEFRGRFKAAEKFSIFK